MSRQRGAAQVEQERGGLGEPRCGGQLLSQCQVRARPLSKTAGWVGGFRRAGNLSYLAVLPAAFLRAEDGVRDGGRALSLRSSASASLASQESTTGWEGGSKEKARFQPSWIPYYICHATLKTPDPIKSQT